MVEIKLERLSFHKQLSQDPLKIFALAEKTIMASALTALVFFIMDISLLCHGFSRWGVVSGTIGYLAIAVKKMYRDEAYSELRLNANLESSILRDLMRSIDYSEKQEGIYFPKDKVFSFFFSCRSEIITFTQKNDIAVITGPHDRLVKLSRAI